MHFCPCHTTKLQIFLLNKRIAQFVLTQTANRVRQQQKSEGRDDSIVFTCV